MNDQKGKEVFIEIQIEIIRVKMTNLPSSPVQAQVVI